MLKIIKRKIFKYQDIWFPDESVYPIKGGCDVCCLIGVPKLSGKQIKSVCYNSLVTNLDVDNFDKDFDKVTQYDIRRSERDDLEIFHYGSDYLRKHYDIFESFSLIYNEMYKAKGLSSTANIGAMKTMMNNNGLLMSCVKCNADVLAYHVYVADGKNARLWMSTSIFRESEDKQFRAKVGRANKRLHHEDLKYFKEQGYEKYDWGGISSFENPNGIDKFKMSFGGKRITYYDETFICSKRYKMFYNFKRGINKWKMK